MSAVEGASMPRGRSRRRRVVTVSAEAAAGAGVGKWAALPLGQLGDRAVDGQPGRCIGFATLLGPGLSSVVVLGVNA